MVEIRFLKSGELPIWVKLRLEALADAPEAFGDTVHQAKLRSDEEWRESLLDRDGSLLVAFDGQLPVGMARVARSEETESSAGLYSMWVAPSARRNGVGRALMDAQWSGRSCNGSMKWFSLLPRVMALSDSTCGQGSLKPADSDRCVRIRKCKWRRWSGEYHESNSGRRSCRLESQ